jgi:hypothetical protein
LAARNKSKDIFDANKKNPFIQSLKSQRNIRNVNNNSFLGSSEPAPPSNRVGGSLGAYKGDQEPRALFTSTSQHQILTQED